MRTDFPSYRRTTELEADAMINEGGAIRQPSMRDAEAAFARLNTPCSCLPRGWRPFLHNRTNLFWAGFATGLAISLLEKHPGKRT